MLAVVLLCSLAPRLALLAEADIKDISMLYLSLHVVCCTAFTCANIKEFDVYVFIFYLIHVDQDLFEVA